MKRKRGFYFVIEGIDGSGKTTQMRLLQSHLKSLGLEPVTTCEPGGTRIGRKIRQILLHDEDVGMITPRANVLGFNFDRAVLVDNVIKRDIKEGRVVISDRSRWSTVAYQCFGGDLDLESTVKICQYAVGDCVPDRIFLLDVSVQEARARMKLSGEKLDHFDSRPADFHENIREGYEHCRKLFEDITTVIDGNRSQDEVFRDLSQEVLELIGVSVERVN